MCDSNEGGMMILADVKTKQDEDPILVELKKLATENKNGGFLPRGRWGTLLPRLPMCS